LQGTGAGEMGLVSKRQKGTLGSDGIVQNHDCGGNYELKTHQIILLNG